MKLRLSCGLILIGLAALGLWQLKTAVYAPGPLEEAITVIVAKGDNSYTVARKLKESGVIGNVLLFKLFARFYQVDKKLQAGEYAFTSGESLAETIKKIASGEVVYRKITLPEGLTKREMLALIAADDMLSGEITVDVTEGEMLPETYTYTLGMSKDSIILRAKEEMRKTLNEAWANRDIDVPLQNKQQLLVLASIVEKETGLTDERGLVASVFANRLKKEMKLQTDPTVIYALTMGEKDLGRLLSKKDLSYDSPFNTYVYYGLPPTPICSPGKAAIEAAANPQNSEYLYFVATGNGGHNFSRSLSEHNNNVTAYRKLQKNK
mgnify:CR=1 FL=1